MTIIAEEHHESIVTCVLVPFQIILVWHEAEVCEVDAHLGGDFLLGEGL
jgi:hypothetical protein